MSDPQIWFCFCCARQSATPHGGPAGRALRFTSERRSCEDFGLRVELLNTPWRRFRFLAVCDSPCAGRAAALRREFAAPLAVNPRGEPYRRKHKWLELNAEVSAVRAAKSI